MRKVIVLLIMVLVLGLSASCLAMSTEGPTGLVEVPSADVVPANSIEVAFHGGGNGSAIGLTAGLIPNLELGVISSTAFGGSDLYGHIKYRLVKETTSVPAIALGVADEQYYVAVSKALSNLGVRSHFGVRSEAGMYLGLSKVLNPVTVTTSDSRFAIPTVSVSGEYDGGGFNLGLNMEFQPDIRFRLSVHDLEAFRFGVGFRTSF